MVNFMLNGEVVGAESDADTPLLWVLREELKLRGTKSVSYTHLTLPTNREV